MMNEIRMNDYKQEDLRYDLLKGVNIYDKLEYEHEEVSIEEVLKTQKQVIK